MAPGAGSCYLKPTILPTSMPFSLSASPPLFCFSSPSLSRLHTMAPIGLSYTSTSVQPFIARSFVNGSDIDISDRGPEMLRVIWTVTTLFANLVMGLRIWARSIQSEDSKPWVADILAALSTVCSWAFPTTHFLNHQIVLTLMEPPLDFPQPVCHICHHRRPFRLRQAYCHNIRGGGEDSKNMGRQELRSRDRIICLAKGHGGLDAWPTIWSQGEMVHMVPPRPSLFLLGCTHHQHRPAVHTGRPDRPRRFCYILRQYDAPSPLSLTHPH